MTITLTALPEQKIRESSLVTSRSPRQILRDLTFSHIFYNWENIKINVTDLLPSYRLSWSHLGWPQVGRRTGAMSGEVFYGRSVGRSVCRSEGSLTVEGIVGRQTADGRKFWLLFRTAQINRKMVHNQALGKAVRQHKVSDMVRIAWPRKHPMWKKYCSSIGCGIEGECHQCDPCGWV